MISTEAAQPLRGVRPSGCKAVRVGRRPDGSRVSRALTFSRNGQGWAYFCHVGSVVMSSSIFDARTDSVVRPGKWSADRVCTQCASQDLLIRGTQPPKTLWPLPVEIRVHVRVSTTYVCVCFKHIPMFVFK